MSSYIQGVRWFLLSCVVSVLNDTLIKVTGQRLPGIEVAFLRFFFSMLVLIPFVVQAGRSFFKTSHLRIHGLRSLFLFLALAPWCYGVISLPLSLVTTLSFTTPLFVLLLSAIFLKESVGLQRMFATLLGFVGILVSVGPFSFNLNGAALLLVASTVLFASLDVMNKKLLIQNEGLLSMLFFSAVGTTLLSAPFAFSVWVMPNLFELGTMFVLGIGANLILFCLLKAFQFCDVSSLQPMRYAELLISSCIGFVLFQEVPSITTLGGAALIIPATLYIVRFEIARKKKGAPEVKVQAAS